MPCGLFSCPFPLHYPDERQVPVLRILCLTPNRSVKLSNRRVPELSQASWDLDARAIKKTHTLIYNHVLLWICGCVTWHLGFGPGVHSGTSANPCLPPVTRNMSWLWEMWAFSLWRDAIKAKVVVWRMVHIEEHGTTVCGKWTAFKGEDMPNCVKRW